MQYSFFRCVLFAMALCMPIWVSAASLNQAAWVPDSGRYHFGYRSIPNIRITKAPADTDWKRWAMLHDGAAYRLYFFRQGSRTQLYQFAFNRSSNAYEYGYNQSIPILTLVGAPEDADFSSFSMLHDGQDYRLYVRPKGNPKALYQFAWVPDTATYQFGYRSIPKMDITGFPEDADWRRWQMLHDGNDYRLYVFVAGGYQFYQGAFKRETENYEYSYRSIPVLTLVGVPEDSNRHSAAMLHDGDHYRFYFQAP